MAGRRGGSAGMTPLELKIMQVLWRLGPSQVQAVQQELDGELADTDGADDAERAGAQGTRDAAAARAGV